MSRRSTAGDRSPLHSHNADRTAASDSNGNISDNMAAEHLNKDDSIPDNNDKIIPVAKGRKRKTPKERRKAKPKTKERTKARSHQNFRERYLNLKKRVDVLQPHTGPEQGAR